MNQDTSFFSEAFRIFIQQAPILVVSLAAVIMAVVKWRQAPTPSLLCFLGFGLILLLSLVSPVVYTWLPRLMRDRPGLGGVYTAIGILHAFLLAIAFAVILLAIFADRNRPTAAAPPPQSGRNPAGPV
jgi:hypothetical protein